MSIDHMSINAATTTGALPAPGRPPENEDAWGSTGRLAWVVAGTPRPAGVQGQTGGEYARALSYALEQAADPQLSLRAIVNRAISAAPHLPASADDPGAEASLALVRLGAEATEWLALGDCSVLLPPPGPGEEAIVKTDERVRHVAGGSQRRFFAARQKAAGKCGTGGREVAETADGISGGPSEASGGKGLAAWRAARLHRRLAHAGAKMRNLPEGYWAAAGYPNASLEAEFGRYAVAGPVCLASAGALAQPDDWFSWTAPGADLDTAVAEAAADTGDTATVVVVAP